MCRRPFGTITKVMVPNGRRQNKPSQFPTFDYSKEPRRARGVTENRRILSDDDRTRQKLQRHPDAELLSDGTNVPEDKTQGCIGGKWPEAETRTKP